MIHPYLLLAPALLLLSIPLHAQTTWESAQRGAEGAYFESVYRTPGGALLGGTPWMIVRYDHDADRWSETLSATERHFDWTFAGDSTGAIYAGSSRALYHSSDDGRSWDAVAHEGTIVTSLEERSVLIIGPRGRSIDGGRTWSPREQRPLYFPTDARGGRLLASSGDSLVESVDTGSTWRAISSIPWTTTQLLVDREVVIALGYNEIWRSTDSGRTWSIDSMPGAASALASDGDMFFASQSSFGMRVSDGVYRSTDRGATWFRVTRGVVSWLATRGASELWAGFGSHAMLSTDDGVTWARADEGLAGRSGPLHTAADGTIYVSIYDGSLNTGNGGYSLRELMRTDDDGRSWRSLHDSVTAVGYLRGGWGMLITVATIVPGTVAGVNDVRHVSRFSSDRGETWRDWLGGHGRMIDANATGMALATTFRSDSVATFVTVDSGANWRLSDIPYALRSGVVTPGGAIIVGARDHRTDSSLREYVLRSTDSGTTWHTLVSGAGYEWRFYAFGNDVVALVPPSLADSVARVMRSTDNGDTWSTTLSGVNPWHVIRDSTALVLFAYDDPRTGSVAISHSTDSGATWMTNRAAPPIASHLPSYTHGNEIFASMNGALVRTLDHGMTWTTIASGSPARPWHSAASNGRVLIAASDRLLRTAAPASAPELSLRHPRPAELTATPLPARESVTIEAPCAGPLLIVDANGELVQRTTISTPGLHVVDVRGLASGAYLVRLECADEAVVGRVIVAR